MKKRSERGFSLLETLVAFVVLALAMSAILPTLSNLTRRIGVTEHQWAANQLSASLIAEIGIVHPVRQGVRRGVWDDRYEWRITTRPGPPQGAGVSDTYELTVEVSRKNSRDVLWTDVVYFYEGYR